MHPGERQNVLELYTVFYGDGERCDNQICQTRVLADARLIIAAPDLLTVCKAQARLIEGLRATNSFYRIGKYPTEAALDKITDAADVQKAAAEAIAKAEGAPASLRG